MKTFLSTVLIVVALGSSLPAQTMAEQLQRAIYTEETIGNKDEATRLYRQILAAPSLPEAISAEAQRRLAKLLLAASPRPSTERAFLVPVVEEPRGLVERGRYRHLASGITFVLPPGWSAGPTYPSSDDGDGVSVTDGTRTILVWMIKEATPADQVLARVAAAPARKVEQRLSGYDIPGAASPSAYTIIADTVRPLTINGRHAIAATAGYVGFPSSGAGISGMREHMTWIYTEQSRVFFYARVPFGDLPDLIPAFEQLVNSAEVP